MLRERDEKQELTFWGPRRWQSYNSLCYDSYHRWKFHWYLHDQSHYDQLFYEAITLLESVGEVELLYDPDSLGIIEWVRFPKADRKSIAEDAPRQRLIHVVLKAEGNPQLLDQLESALKNVLSGSDPERALRRFRRILAEEEISADLFIPSENYTRHFTLPPKLKRKKSSTQKGNPEDFQGSR